MKTITFEGHVMERPDQKPFTANEYRRNDFVCAFPSDHEFFAQLSEFVRLDREGKIAHDKLINGQRIVKCKLVFEVDE